MVERGFANDVELAVALNVSQHVSRYEGVALIDDQELTNIGLQPTAAVDAPERRD